MTHFFRPGADALPPEDVRVTGLRAEPLDAGERIRVYLDLTPFRQPPDVFITLSDLTGTEIAHAHLIGVVNTRLTIVMHLRNAGNQRYILTALVNYPQQGISNPYSVTIERMNPSTSKDTPQ